jgi:hypothetical protein
LTEARTLMIYLVTRVVCAPNAETKIASAR